MNEATATMIVKMYPTIVQPTTKLMNPIAKQKIAIQELNFCCVTSSGIYWFPCLIKKSLANFIIGLKLNNKPIIFATSGIVRIHASPVTQVKITERKIVH